MIRKTMLALGALVLAATAAPARAEQASTSLFENYVDLFDATTFHTQREGGKKGTILVAGQFLAHTVPVPGPFEVDTQLYGGGVGYAQDRWQIGFSAGNAHLELDPGNVSADAFFFTVHGKYVVWKSKDGKTHAALIGGYQDFDGGLNRIDALAALSHAITPDVTATANVGYGRIDASGISDQDDLVAGIGLTFVPRQMPRLRLSVEYVFENDIQPLSGLQGGDQWNAKLSYQASRNVRLYVGGGQHQRYLGGVQVTFN